MASIPSASGGTRPIDTIQQLVKEQIDLAPYARGHSSHWPSHKEMVFADLGYKSKREFMATMFLSFYQNVVSSILPCGPLGHLVSMSPSLKEKPP